MSNGSKPPGWHEGDPDHHKPEQEQPEQNNPPQQQPPDDKSGKQK